MHVIKWDGAIDELNGTARLHTGGDKNSKTKQPTNKKRGKALKDRNNKRFTLSRNTSEYPFDKTWS